MTDVCKWRWKTIKADGVVVAQGYARGCDGVIPSEDLWSHMGPCLCGKRRVFDDDSLFSDPDASAIERNAKRYAWLRDGHVDVVLKSWGHNEPPSFYNRRDLDAVIDAEMALSDTVAEKRE